MFIVVFLRSLPPSTGCAYCAKATLDAASDALYFREKGNPLLGCYTASNEVGLCTCCPPYCVRPPYYHVSCQASVSTGIKSAPVFSETIFSLAGAKLQYVELTKYSPPYKEFTGPYWQFLRHSSVLKLNSLELSWPLTIALANWLCTSFKPWRLRGGQVKGPFISRLVYSVRCGTYTVISRSVD